MAWVHTVGIAQWLGHPVADNWEMTEHCQPVFVEKVQGGCATGNK